MDAPARRPRIGISACLLGQEVRYDGGHKRDPWIAGVLGRFVEFVPVCPEVEVGMGTPRPPVRLERAADGGIRMVEPASGTDLTAAMERFADGRARALEREHLAGYVLKRASPSCGLRGVEVRDGSGRTRREGRGLFAAALVRRLPLLPVEEEGRLRDPRRRENFLARIAAAGRLRPLLAARPTGGALRRFHAGERWLLLAHDPEGTAALDRLVGEAPARPGRGVAAAYAAGFMTALARLPTRRRHGTVLAGMARLLRGRLDPRERDSLADALRRYRRGGAALEVPRAALRRLARRHGEAGLLGQSYLEAPPGPAPGRSAVPPA